MQVTAACRNASCCPIECNIIELLVQPAHLRAYYCVLGLSYYSQRYSAALPYYSPKLFNQISNCSYLLTTGCWLNIVVYFRYQN